MDTRERILKLMENNHITKYRLAKEINVSSGIISDWASGKSTSYTKYLDKIANYFGVTVDYLLTGKEPEIIDSGVLTPKDKKDIAKDMERIREKLMNKEDGPASFDGENISDESADLLLAQIESMLGTIKLINKEKYNPNKNKKKK
jgi:transcriptional regulator with XRE-family HTH domain